MVALLHSDGAIGKAMTMPCGGLYKKQFQAKTNWIVTLGPYEMVRGDQRDFACGPWKFGNLGSHRHLSSQVYRGYSPRVATFEERKGADLGRKDGSDNGA
jgi:hypothetical protein